MRRPLDYVVERERVVENMTLERVRELARRYVDPARMVFLVVGDARTQLPRLSAAGLGLPLLIDRNARPTEGASTWAQRSFTRRSFYHSGVEFAEELMQGHLRKQPTK